MRSSKRNTKVKKDAKTQESENLGKFEGSTKEREDIRIRTERQRTREETIFMESRKVSI